MRRAALALVTTVAGLVLLLGFKSRPAVTTQPSSVAAPVPAAGAAPGTAATATPAPAATPAASVRTVLGPSIDTRYGPVQVKVTLHGMRITGITPVQLPSDNPRDVEINNFAVPVLLQEALAAQSAAIDSVSGATYTSDGYTRSLQGALDAAGG